MKVVPDSGAIRGQLVLLAPLTERPPEDFHNIHQDSGLHARLLADMQKLRADVYLSDGAIQPWQLRATGRHHQVADDSSWHILSLRADGSVVGCSRYTQYRSAEFARLGLRKCPLAQSEEWRDYFREAIEYDMALAAQRAIDYVEVGGWALAPGYRCSAEAPRIALATYSLARMLGGCIGVGTVTRRHCASSILRRIGGRSLTIKGVELPGYFDARYGCDMEVLRFDSGEPNARYETWVRELGRYLQCAPVIFREPVQSICPPIYSGAESGTLRDATNFLTKLVRAV